MKKLLLYLGLLSIYSLVAQDITYDNRKIILNSPNSISLFQTNSTNGIWASGMVTYDRWSVFEDATSSKEWFTIEPGGYVGIGVANPLEKMQIANSFTFHDGGHKVIGFVYGPSGDVDLDASKYSGELRFDPTNGNLRFGTSNSISDSPITRMTLTNTGRVGIGTTNPNSELSVNGIIHAKEVKVDLIGWPDYVFKEDYDLPPLEEVEKHIREKGHLINIPSAKEVAKNGIQLGKMNKLLLEKIEELTLYAIKQEKYINSLLLIKEEHKILQDKLQTLETTVQGLIDKNEK